jgi:nitrogen-specific signal transduction histidine kinase
VNTGLTPASLSPAQPDALGELVHSLSQPLTTLRCALELSVGQSPEQQEEAVAAALEQTDRLMRAVRLMQKYLESERTPAARE